MHVMQESTIKTMACLVALASGIMEEVVGDDVSVTVNGSDLSRDVLDSYVSNAINQRIGQFQIQAGDAKRARSGV